MFGVVVPSQTIQIFQKLSETEFGLVLNNPQTIFKLCYFLTSELDTQYGGALFYSINNIDWIFLTAVSSIIKSQFIQLDWNATIPISRSFVYLKSTILPANKVLELMSTKPQQALQHEYGKRVALNLYNYLTSFELNKININNALTAWLKRFDEKCAIDPDYILKYD